ncbi:MAG: TetR/AcrR family transcriptional regulator [Myxococcota bacterium]|nr:TetR/AcrR family transcriptional regulator [Myxococcota bacterium]
MGGRSARVLHAVLEATLEELARVGYVALTFEGVASRAHVNRTTIYRRWPNKVALVHAAMLANADTQVTMPDTGSIRSDLLSLARQRIASMSLPRVRAIAAALMNEPPESELLTGTEVFRERSRAQVAEVIGRAAERGELPPNVDADLIHRPLYAVLFAGVLLKREMPTESFLTRLIDALLVGAVHDARSAR